MDGYSRIGMLYILPSLVTRKRLVWVVIENDLNDQTSTLQVIEDCPEYGYKHKINSQWLYEQEPVGIILDNDDAIVCENGREFIRNSEAKELGKVLAP